METPQRTPRTTRTTSASRAATVLAATLVITAFVLPVDSVRTATAGPDAPPCPAPAVAGHRGAPRTAPENTMAAFRAALDGGADWLETDVRTTRDGVPVLMHDDTVDRVTDGHGGVADLTYEQIASLRVTAGPGPAQPVPTLQELLDTLAGTGTRLLMEIKEQRDPEDAARIARTAAASGADVVLYSFFPDHLREAHRAAPGLPVVLLQGRFLAREPDGLRLDGIALDEPLATADRIAAEHAAGHQVYVWTLDDDTAWRTMADRHADALVTDTPADARRWADRQCGRTP
ncbi:glycerophosphodiester phosphodiesterase [Kitasatospora sp. NBC_01539]|uniref:glycerophosphodiester phosphodiesterase n=1 Tax=Kitasatospora sp. NBC_01539 TaxID=2903577 RepID=UPI003860219B